MTDFFTRQDEMLKKVLAEDCATLAIKDRSYDGSWRKRGGTGAFFMLARKWDRLESILSRCPKQYDVLIALQKEDEKGLTGQDGSVMAEIRDLRRYLALVEAYFLIQKQAYSNSAAPAVDKVTPKTNADPIVLEEALNERVSNLGPIGSAVDPDSEMEHRAANRG